MITTKRPNTDDYTQVGFIEAKDNNGVYQNIDKIYDNQGNIVFQQGYLNEYQGADDFGIPAIGKPLIDYTIWGNSLQNGTPTPDSPIEPEFVGERTENLFDKSKALLGYEIYGGTLIPNSNWGVSDYIPIENNKIYAKTGAGNGSLLYNEIDGTPTLKIFITNFTNTSEAKYLRINFPLSNIDQVAVKQGSTALPYEPYGYKIPISSGGSNLLEIVPEMKNKDNWSPFGPFFMYYKLPDGIAENLKKSGTISGKVFLRTGGSYYSGLVFAITPFNSESLVSNEYRLLRSNGSTVDYTQDISSWENIYLCIGYTQGVASANKQTLVDALFDNWDIMLVCGTTVPTSYQPYTSRTVKNIYLGQTPTTRKIKKLVLTGEEDWINNSNNACCVMYLTDLGLFTSYNPLIICSHVLRGQNQGQLYYRLVDYGITFGGTAADRICFRNKDCEPVADFKVWLAQQYAAGTPVTVWYVLANEETAVVNEPLMKIGDYADSVDFSQAGVEIPTLKKPNTTVIDVETSLEPSEIDVTYRGSTKPQYDLFLAKNGESFEAKDGQSLYIGGNP